MKIIAKSDPENFEKERSGIKPNTVRELDGKDIIEIINTKTDERFEREITDITTWKKQIIISFKTRCVYCGGAHDINNCPSLVKKI